MYSDVLCHRCHCNACALSELMQSQVQQMDGAELHDYSFGLLGLIRNTARDMHAVYLKYCGIQQMLVNIFL